MADPLAPLLEGYAEDRLRLPVCEDCGCAHLYPRARCPHCGSARLSWREASGRATLASWSVVHRAPSPDLAGEVPYTVALVKLVEGPQMMARVVDAEEAQLRLGLPLALRFASLPGGERRPVFAPEERTP
jgi:uncharacterized OB-fold protein